MTPFPTSEILSSGLVGLDLAIRPTVPGQRDDTPIVPIANLPKQRAFTTQDGDLAFSLLHQEITHLTATIRQLEDKIGKQIDVLNDVVAWVENGLEHGTWRTYDQTKRLLSRVKGSIAYRGLSDGMYRKFYEGGAEK